MIEITSTFIKQIVLFYGIVLCLFACIFWYYYHRKLKKLKNLPLPPMTSIVIFIGFFAIFILMSQNNVVKIIFGDDSQLIRTNILNMLGVLFTGFLLIITISWGLIAAGKVENIQKRVYFQSYLMAGLFFYIAAGFYSILASLT
jgi:hypothetical protein